METIRFEWDENKNSINKEKHHIAFEEAKTVFYDEEALVIDDPEHSEEEERFIILGFSKKANLRYGHPHHFCAKSNHKRIQTISCLLRRCAA